MQFQHADLESSARAMGTVIVVDVLRAFTTSAFAFDRGALEILLVASVDEACALRKKYPELLLMGEVNGYPVEGFDLPNSPSMIRRQDLRGRRLVLRTTAGTQGVVRAAGASALYVASLCVASATARAVARDAPDTITFVNSGVRAGGGGEEDVACSDFIASIIEGNPMNRALLEIRVRKSKAASKFSAPDGGDFARADLELALDIDRFDFAMSVTREDEWLVLRKV